MAETTDRWRGAIGRTGLVAMGVVSFILGLLVVQFAQVGNDVANAVSETGAIEKLSDQPFGKFLLVALTVGLAALTLWYVIIAATGDPAQGSDAKIRALAALSALVAIGLFITALKITIDNWNGGGTENQGGGGAEKQEATDTLFDLPAGRFLIILIGVVLIGIAVFQLYKHVIKTQFMERLRVDGKAEHPIRLIGQAGYGAKAAVLALTGVFFATAAIRHNPEEPKDLSGVLAELASHTWGKFALWFIAVGLALFGLFCFAEARFRRTV